MPPGHHLTRYKLSPSSTMRFLNRSWIKAFSHNGYRNLFTNARNNATNCGVQLATWLRSIPTPTMASPRTIYPNLDQVELTNNLDSYVESTFLAIHQPGLPCGYTFGGGNGENAVIHHHWQSTRWRHYTWLPTFNYSNLWNEGPSYRKTKANVFQNNRNIPFSFRLGTKRNKNVPARCTVGEDPKTTVHYRIDLRHRRAPTENYI